jgi:hypothetical protein
LEARAWEIYVARTTSAPTSGGDLDEQILEKKLGTPAAVPSAAAGQVHSISENNFTMRGEQR